MVKGKKITKKKLKEPDEFITFTERALQSIRAHLKKIAAVGIVLLVILLTVGLFLMWEKRKEGEAYQKFALATEIYQRATSPSREASAPDYKSALERFDEIVKKFPRTSAGRFSLLYEGNIHLKMGEYEEAIKVYSAFIEKGPKEKLFRYFAMEGLGYAYGGKKEYEKALAAYQKAVELGDGFEQAGAYLNMGVCYEKLGKNKEALESYKNFLKSGQKSPMINAVMRKISLLGG